MRDGMQARAMNRRLLLEEICSDVLRSSPSARSARVVGIDREWNLGVGEFADMRVRHADGREAFMEIKAGYSSSEIVRRLAAKYGSDDARYLSADQLVVVVDRRDRRDGDALLAAMREAVTPRLELEVWDEQCLDARLRALFGCGLESFSDEATLVHLRRKIIAAKASVAFGPGNATTDETLRHALLWHLAEWRLKELREALGDRALDDHLVPAGHYEGAVVLIADLCSFSSFVRDTPDEEITRASLTAFYAKARDQITDAGGMFYQFVGDEVSAVFGVPDRRAGYVREALRTARALQEIARSVTTHWQRRIDRVQSHCAAHIGMAMGDLDLVAQRPFDSEHFGAFGDCLNIAARLLHTARPDEIVISNVLRQEIEGDDYRCEERDKVEIKNMGVVRSWLLHPESLVEARSAGPRGTAPLPPSSGAHPRADGR